MDLSPNEIINKIVTAEIEVNDKLKKAEEELKKEMKRKIADLEKKKIERFEEINKNYYDILKDTEASSKKIINAIEEDILKAEKQFTEIEENIDKIVLNVLDKIIL